MPANDVFPTLHCCSQLGGGETLYDVKFFPYPTADEDQIFAVVGERDVFICRPTLEAEQPFELLRWFKEEDENASYNSTVWTKDPETRKPLLCVAGRTPKQIKILDIETGQPIRTLAGHGRGINDLAVSPLSTDLIASASEDYTIRLWNLRPEFKDQPCVAMFCGEGHKQPILAVHFHPNGRWLLSGGLDTAVCLWRVPSHKDLSNRKEDGEPQIIYYPHFYSTEVHHNYVDCLQFYGDLILSRASKGQTETMKTNEIILWKIEGFDPNEAPPDEPPIPESDVHTRSSFEHSQRSRGFQRLLSFKINYTDRFYHRFGLLHEPGMRPILCMGNQESKFLFWDLQRLEEGTDPVDDKKGKRGAKTSRKNKTHPSSENLNRLSDLRSESVASDGTGGTTPMPSSTSNSAPPDRKFALSDPFTPLAPHVTVHMPPKVSLSRQHHFATSQLAWSPDGTWLVGCGDNGMMCIFHRDKSVVNGTQKAAGATMTTRVGRDDTALQ